MQAELQRIFQEIASVIQPEPLELAAIAEFLIDANFSVPQYVYL